jgi:primosomal protein N' (replication factor Y)
LEALAGRVVGEVTATRSIGLDADVLVGTEAVLHRVSRADTVVFLDFDQHLLAARYRADEEAFALLARASRLTGGRRGGRDRPPGRVFVQTRLPDHPVLAAAAVADPGRLSAYERPLRQSLRLPPSVALATVSGPAAPAFVEHLQSVSTEGLAPGLGAAPGSAPVEILGPAEDRWLLRAATSAALADALAAVPRPPGRLRIEVDPLRV